MGLILDDPTNKNTINNAPLMYYFYYLRNIHEIINKNLLFPIWLDIYEIEAIANESVCFPIFNNSNDTKDLFKVDHFKQNPWLNTNKNNPLNLAKNILDNGMICPFILTSNTKTGKLHYVNATHRLSSLISYEHECQHISKKFLTLCYEPSISIEMEPILLYLIMNTELVYKSLVRDVKGLFLNMDVNGGAASCTFFDYNKFIQKSSEPFNLMKPIPCLNDEEEFKNFIQTPWDDEKYYNQIKLVYPNIINPVKNLY